MSRPVKVLIVEDSEDDATLALWALRRGGFEPTYRRVQTAAEVESALAGERWDAVLSDFQMPGFTGMDALRIFRSTGLDIPFILVSGTIGEEIAVEAMKAGANDYLMKANLVRLAPALERELKETQMRAAHRRTQESLTESEQRFRQLAENIRDVFFLRDADSDRMLYISPAYEDIWGRSCESVYANPQSWNEVIHPDDRASTCGKYKKGRSTGKYAFEYRIVRPDGSIRWIETRGFPVRDGAGKLVRIAGVVADITERKRTEENLLRFRAAMDATADAIVLVNRRTMLFVEANATACSMFGYTRAELLQIGPADLGAAPLERVKTVHDAVIAGHGTNELAETQLRRKDGSHVQVEVHRHALRSGADWIVVGVLRDISERKRAEKEIRSLSKFPAENPNPVLRIERNGAILYANQMSAPILTAWGREVGQNVPDDWQKLIAETFESGIGNEVDIECNRRIFSCNLAPVLAGDYVNVYGRDITVQKRAADGLRESKNLLQLVVEHVPSRIFWKDHDLRYLGCNTLFAKDAGYSRPDELTGKTDFEMGWKDQAELYRGDDKRVLESGASKLDIEEPQTTPDGNTIWLRTSKVPLRDKSSRIIGILGLYQDITERKQAEQNLRESERRFTDLLGNVELVSVMRDREERITYCNEYLLRLTGWKFEEVIGRNWVECFVPPEITEMKKKVFAALLLNKPEAWHHESEILTRAGERRLIRWNNSVLRSGDGDVIGTASIGEDITEQKRAERGIKRLNRAYAVLSGINALIVRMHDRDELFREACRIATEEGGFRMSMIAIVDRSAMAIVPVASAGVDEELLTAIKGHLSSSGGASEGESTFARVIRERKAVVSNVSPTNSTVIFSKIFAGSTAVFPLVVADEAIGVLALFASESEFFQEEEIKLLTELAGDIAFAIHHIEKEERLNYLAYYDALTGLANRTLFLERLAQYVRSAGSSGHKLAVALIDLERFKNINDSLGRPAGDALLRQVAEWLTRATGDASLLARVGADHFAGVLPEVKQDGDVARLLEKTMAAFLEHPFRLNDAVFRISAKVGVALFPDDGADADTLFKNAEAALKKAKASGDRYLFYTQKMTEAVAGKLTLENQLRQALDKGEFVLHYQPKVNLASGKMTSAEALIRWNDPRTGLVPPGRFIPILEETGLIFEVGRWALRQAIEDYLRWRSAGLPAVRIAVNVSPLQLRNRGFIDEIGQAIGIDAQAPAGLELEITESLIMEDVKHSIASLQAIRAMGVTIAIDDFGTGFSSLSYLAKLPVDALKIDRSFVIDMTGAPEGLALVSTIISLAHSLKLKVVAEGVETEEQSSLLRLLSCDEMQGFLFSKPVPGEIFETRFLAPPAAG